jgi:PadR family transcriptional regulator PadR
MLLGGLEEMILRVLLHLKNDAYGVEVTATLSEIAGYPPSAFGNVYTTLVRLSGKGFVTSKLGEVEHCRGGRAKRYYSVTESGISVLRDIDNIRIKLQPEK